MELGEVVTTTELREDQRGNENHVGGTKQTWAHMDPVIPLSLKNEDWANTSFNNKHVRSIFSSKTFRTTPLIQFLTKQETDPAGKSERRKPVVNK